MKLFIFIIVFISIGLTGYAQKYDYQWLMGMGGVSNTIQLFSTNMVDFNSGAPIVTSSFKPYAQRKGSVAANDRYGVLQFYTNGFKVFDRYDGDMPNGDSLSPGGVFNEFNDAGSSPAYPHFHGATVLPAVFNDSVYYLIHGGWEYGTTYSSYCKYWFYSTIDMRLNNGLGAVTDKNKIIVDDTLIGGSGMAACKHANGKDWWIIAQEMYSNCFYKFLLTSHGVDSIGKQCIGDMTHFDLNRGANVFTPDGSKYIWSNPYEHLNILDFNRCTGEFTRHRRFTIEDSLPKLQGQGMVYLDGVSVSPNSRYLYLSTISEVRQFDLNASDILASEVIVANTLLDSPKTSVCFSQMASDGKIYLVAFAQDTFLHVIDYPDSVGMACGFRKNAIALPGYNHTYLPFYPHYRLGALTGSPCDTIQTGMPKATGNKTQITVYPNPVSYFLTVDYGDIDWSKGELTLKVINHLGQVVHTQPLQAYSGFQKIDVSEFADGIYLATINHNGQLITKEIFVKE